MPKKRQPKTLLIKPGTSFNSQLSDRAARPKDGNASSVNDLIRESRRLQIRNEQYPAASAISSIPPSLREVLSLPAPPPPDPRAGTPCIGPTRRRRIPGPPPPRSWLADSIHAPVSCKNTPEYEIGRLQTTQSLLPDGGFPDARSLQHLILKRLASHWNWHAEFDHQYLAELPVLLKQWLLSYIAIYCDDPQTNPFRLLFMGEADAGSQGEVTRLDLTGAIGVWTTLHQLFKDFSNRQQLPTEISQNSSDMMSSWDDSDDIDYGFEERSFSSQPSAFHKLKHLSLALTPGVSASWKDLIRLAGRLPTLESLSLAHWCQPTYTPRAASTRVLITASGSTPNFTYGGSNFYTAFDNDWREAAGILRSLSKFLYCLKWLDLTGCGEWVEALVWQPSDESGVGPEWNGSWRSVEFLGLGVGWTPIAPKLTYSHGPQLGDEEWDVEVERQKYRHRKEVEEHDRIRKIAEKVAQRLRASRKANGGKWIEVDFDEDS